MTFPTYSNYKNSEVEWLVQVPTHWQIERIRLRCNLVTTKAEIKTRPIALENIEPWTGKLISTDTEFQGDGVEFKAGDILFGKLRPYLAKVYVADISGQAVGDFHVIRARESIEIRFVKYCLLTRELISLIDGSTYGAKMPRASWDFIRELRIAFPPISEQVAIADFLDRETAKIDAMMEEQHRLITLLKEKRQAVISHTVTKGLNPDTPMKDSGIEWLGDVPAHWEALPLRRVAERVVVGIAEAAVHAYAEQGTPILRSMNVRAGHLIGDILYINSDYSEDRSSKQMRSGDIVTVRTGHAGVSAVIPPELDGAQCFTMLITTLRKPAVSDFFCLYLNSAPARTYFSIEAWGSAQPNISVPILQDILIPVPPIKEQNAIVEKVSAEILQLDELIASAKSTIDLMTERRAALISAAVTGKIDVRGAGKVRSLTFSRASARGLIAADIIERSAHQTTFGRVKLQKLAYLAEVHAGVTELEGAYLREAAGPLDREMISQMEREAGTLAGIRVEQPDGKGSAVVYQVGGRRGAHRQDLTALLGERTATFDKLVRDIGTIDTKGAEAVATLYAVWNDALIEGETLTDKEIVAGVLTEWHPEKAKKFRRDELQTWLDWMRRHGFIPTGTGPKTSTGRLFA